jgi:Zn-dependent protease with chaperone function
MNQHSKTWNATRRVGAAMVAAGLLVACATDGPLKMPATGAGVVSGTGQAATNGAGGASTSAAAQAGSASVQVGRKQVELATVELDPSCSRLVTPFEPSENVGELTMLGAELAGQAASVSAAEYLQNLLASKPTRSTTGVATGAELKRGLPMNIRRAALRMNWLPMSLEQMYGQRQLDELKAAARLLPRDARNAAADYRKADAMLAEVLAGVKQANPYKFELFISTESSENAKAYPGGFIVIDPALIRKPALNDKAYFALSHEIAHVLQRHETRALQARVIDSLSFGASLPELIKTIHQAHSEPAAVMRLLVGGKLLFEKHAESQELQADACALRVLDTGLANDRRLLAAVQGFVNSLPKPKPEVHVPAKPNAAEELGKLSDLVSRPVDSHPTTEARVNNLRTMLVKLRERPANAKHAGVPPKANGKAPIPLPTVIKPKVG